MNRRSILIGIGSVLAAPAIVRASSLMKIVVPKIVVPQPWLIQWGPVADFINGDLEASFEKMIAADIVVVQRRINMALAADLFIRSGEIIAADWPSRTIKAPPGGFKFARG